MLKSFLEKFTKKYSLSMSRQEQKVILLIKKTSSIFISLAKNTELKMLYPYLWANLKALHRILKFSKFEKFKKTSELRDQKKVFYKLLLSNQSLNKNKKLFKK